MICRNAVRMLSVKPRQPRPRPATPQPSRANTKPARPAAQRAMSLVELLIALAITALLLTATMVAIDASFQAYAAAAQTASTQTATRMVVHRLLTLVRTSTAHGPLLEVASGPMPVTLVGNLLQSPYIELIDTKGRLLRVEYRSDVQQLWVLTEQSDGTAVEEPMLGGVTACSFHLSRRKDNDGVWVLERGSLDMTVEPDSDNTLAVEGGQLPPIRVIASTAPRKLE
jgi:prepilin-type N-terminal cleavage/methylation domain-containing protein